VLSGKTIKNVFAVSHINDRLCIFNRFTLFMYIADISPGCDSLYIMDVITIVSITMQCMLFRSMAQSCIKIVITDQVIYLALLCCIGN
jgi:hypothetical protein